MVFFERPARNINPFFDWPSGLFNRVCAGSLRIEARDVAFATAAEKCFDPSEETHARNELMKTNRDRRRITFEALDSWTPYVANVWNRGEVCVALLLRGETPRHRWLIRGRRPLFIFIVFVF